MLGIALAGAEGYWDRQGSRQQRAGAASEGWGGPLGAAGGLLCNAGGYRKGNRQRQREGLGLESHGADAGAAM